MKLMAVLALACGFIAAPVIAAPNASGEPECDGPDCVPAVPYVPSCDGVDCVPYVARNVAQGARCTLATRYVFGLDSSGKTMICTANNVWQSSSAPLVGMRTLGAPCGEAKGLAQTPDGQPLSCKYQAWTADYSGIYFPAPA
jgi:hypothetical protein